MLAQHGLGFLVLLLLPNYLACRVTLTHVRQDTPNDPTRAVIRDSIDNEFGFLYVDSSPVSAHHAASGAQ